MPEFVPVQPGSDFISPMKYRTNQHPPNRLEIVEMMAVSRIRNGELFTNSGRLPMLYERELHLWLQARVDCGSITL
jgi:hypothetical protein